MLTWEVVHLGHTHPNPSFCEDGADSLITESGCGRGCECAGTRWAWSPVPMAGSGPASRTAGPGTSAAAAPARARWPRRCLVGPRPARALAAPVLPAASPLV